MRQDLIESIHKQFPWANCFFTVGTGWYGLLCELLSEIENHYKSNNADISTLVILDVKEKYGGLRFYVDNAINGVEDIILAYENKSETICEKCGDSGWLCVKDGWLKTLCTKCAERIGYEEF